MTHLEYSNKDYVVAEAGGHPDGECVYHVLPIDDYDEHIISGGCWCQPRLDVKEVLTGHEVVVHRNQKLLIKEMPH